VSEYVERLISEDDDAKDVARHEEEERRNAIRAAWGKAMRLAGKSMQEINDARDAEDRENGWTFTEAEYWACFRGQIALENRAKLQKAQDRATVSAEWLARQRAM
jgi:hypothetical protein